MRVISATAKNFGSYKDLAFEFTEAGLALISGPTGAGKSTLCDLLPWVLFGKTAKGGAVDEIRSWDADDVTEAAIYVRLPDRDLKVVRKRGLTAKDNDLYYSQRVPDVRDEIRGKDLNDTQQLLNRQLGIDYETYLSGAYFHEFSQTAAFFTAPAKQRRQITEQLVDFKFVNNLAESGKLRMKTLTGDKKVLENRTSILKERIANLSSAVNRESVNVGLWENKRRTRVADLEALSRNFEADKKQQAYDIEQAHIAKRVELELDLEDALSSILTKEHFTREYEKLDKALVECGDTRCTECGALKDSSQRMIITKNRYALERDESDNATRQANAERLAKSLKSHLALLAPMLETVEVILDGYKEQALKMRQETNPHIESAKISQQQLDGAIKEEQETVASVDTLSRNIADLELLQDITNELRGVLVKNTIYELETHTNKLLYDYFDAEIRVTFSASEADKLDVTITKDGHECSYTQLSKGQRQLLKLCFSVSVMRSVSMHKGVNFNALFFDEALTGADDVFKGKAFKLFEGLASEHESVFVIDHSTDFKSLFTTEYIVELTNGISTINPA